MGRLNKNTMLELEALSKEISSSTLLEQANSLPEIPEAELNSPIETEGLDFKKQTQGLQGQEITSLDELNSPIEGKESSEESGLSLEEKVLLQEETGWSDEIIDSIKTSKEADVYKDAGLRDVNGNLERTDIDWNAKIPQDKIDRMRSLYGDEVADRWSDKTNMDLIKDGKAPYGSDGERINLHHIGQKPNSPLAELTDTEHKTNDGILHDKTKASEIERPVFRKEREAYWRNRYNELNRN